MMMVVFVTKRLSKAWSAIGWWFRFGVHIVSNVLTFKLSSPFITSSRIQLVARKGLFNIILIS